MDLRTLRFLYGGLTLHGFADFIGVHPKTVKRWESGQCNRSTELIYRYVAGFQRHKDWSGWRVDQDFGYLVNRHGQTFTSFDVQSIPYLNEIKYSYLREKRIDRRSNNMILIPKGSDVVLPFDSEVAHEM